MKKRKGFSIFLFISASLLFILPSVEGSNFLVSEKILLGGAENESLPSSENLCELTEERNEENVSRIRYQRILTDTLAISGNQVKKHIISFRLVTSGPEYSIRSCFFSNRNLRAPPLLLAC